ncbi:MAG: TIGR02757 family protein [Desulfobacteraceae bacterium]|nr:MAG: TIGR02757 family protein [Desulfobacteraceae bacterium]
MKKRADDRGAIKARLDSLYRKYHRRDLVHPDPLVFLYDYEDLKDREVVALVASSLAYGRVAQIMKSVSTVLEGMGKSPFLFLMNSSPRKIQSKYESFRHRFTSGAELVHMLRAARGAIEQYGSLQECFCTGLKETDENVLPALSHFVSRFSTGNGECRKGFLPSPDDGSACKRWHLFLRWMVREDEIDPGGWNRVDRSRLIIPLDTHMHRIGLGLSLTNRKQADLRTALEITRAFAEISPEDPVRYDFVLTRFGIRTDMDMRELEA